MCNLNVPSIRWSNFLLISDCWTLPLSILELFKPPLFLSWESCSCLLFWVFALMPQIKDVSFQTPPCTPAPAILSRPPAVPCQHLLWLAGGGLAAILLVAEVLGMDTFLAPQRAPCKLLTTQILPVVPNIVTKQLENASVKIPLQEVFFFFRLIKMHDEEVMWLNRKWG